jgi:hypothetical protein
MQRLESTIIAFQNYQVFPYLASQLVFTKVIFVLITGAEGDNSMQSNPNEAHKTDISSHRTEAPVRMSK